MKKQYAHRYDPKEIEANEFACRLLMPEATFRKMVKEGNTNVIVLAHIFNVPIQAVIRYAKILGYKLAYDK